MRKGGKISPEKRLRILFVVVAEVSVIVLLTAITVATSLVSNAFIAKDADETISYIHDNPDYFFPKKESESSSTTSSTSNAAYNDTSTGSAESSSMETPPAPPDGDGGPGGGNMGDNPPPKPDGSAPSKDILAGLRFFTVVIKNDGQYSTNTTYNYDFDSTTSIEAANKVVSSGSTAGYYGDYRYNLFDTQEGKLAIFLLWTERLEPARIFIVNVGIGMGVGAILALVAIIFVSKLAVKPVEIANAKQRRFVSDASHELKTPLTIISANNEILEMMYGEDETTQTIDRQVKKMTSMIRSLTTLSKLGEVTKAEFAMVDLSSAYLDVCAEFTKTFEHEGKRLTNSIQEGLSINGVENDLRKLLSIYLDNARKYAKSYCHVTLFKEKGDIILRCSNDTLTPMEAGERNEIFERFYRTSDARGSKIEGSGIGLSIAKEIASIHHGSVNCVVSNEGEFIISANFKA
ncbi:MAG: HAMP domain-containing histidine kinase [Bacilli bacterium]|nr:HAMP domain-containing histidine kinase [Bacilli bacterium]